MGAVIDDKVVAMSFESSKFESGVNSTISALDKLKASLHLPGASKGLEDVSAAAKKIDLSHIGSSVDAISQKLGYFSVAAIAIFTNVAMKAVQAGAQFAKAFTVQPIIAGYQEYATNLNAIQTVLANTKASGSTLKDVNAALLELNKYSDKTIYNFGQMAKNIGTFTAAGVDLKTSTAAIKGIANLAALSGSNADQAATAMYQLSQAISSGRVGLQDWNSVVNAGMGGTVFQRALAQTAEAMGTLKKGAVELVGPMKNVKISGESFRESIGGPGPKWLTSEVLTTTLKQFTGDLSAAEIKAMGFNDAQVKAIQQTAKTAMFAATEVKTLSQVLDVAKETAQSGWAQTWQIIFGDFGEAKKTFTGLSNAINGFINANANARNKVLSDWKELGGRAVLIDGIKIAFKNLSAIIAPIKEAFRDIFPATTGKNLYDLTVNFREFAKSLKPSAETVDNLKRTFRGLFAAFDIGKQIIGGIFTMFKSLFKALGGGEGGFLKITANIGDFIVAIDKALKKGDGLNKFFSGLGTVLAIPLNIIKAVAKAIGNMFDGFSPEGFSVNIDAMTKPLEYLRQLAKKVAESFSGIGEGIANAFRNINWNTTLTVVRTGLLGALVLMIKNFLGKGTFATQLGGIGAGLFSNIGKAVGSLTGSMKAMQQNLQAKTLREIAIAIALLAASAVALSLVDPVKLKGALGAMTVMFGELLASLKLLTKVTSGPGFAKIPILAGSLILLAGAIDLLVIAVMAMSRLSWNELVKGLTGVGALLGGIALAVQPLSAGSSGLIRAGIGITALAIALNIMALAVKQFAGMSWTELAKGLGGVGIALGIIVVAVAKMSSGGKMTTGLVSAGAGLILIATGLRILANAVKAFGAMNLETLGKGLGSVAVSLGIIVLAMGKMPPNMVATGVGLIAVGAALNLIAKAVGTMGQMSMKEIGKSMIALAGAMTILGVAVSKMSMTLAGSAALVIMAAGIVVLAKGLQMMASMSLGDIARSLIALAGAMTVLGVAGKLIGTSVPGLMGFGAAMLMIGGAIALAGAGIAAIGIGLSAIAVAGPAAIGILISALTKLTAAIPEMATNLVNGLLSMVTAFADSAPKFVAAMVKIVEMILDVIIKSSPKMVEAFNALLDAALTIFYQNKDRIIQAGMDLIISLLQGIRNNIGQIVTTASQIIVNFFNSLSNNMGKIIAAGAKMIASILTGIGNHLAEIVTAGAGIITKFFNAIATNVYKIVKSGASIITKLLEGITAGITDVINAGANLIIKVVEGLGKNGEKVVTAGTKAVLKFIAGLGKNAIALARGAAQVILDLLNGLTQAIRDYSPQFQDAGWNLAKAILDGMTFGLSGLAFKVYNKVEEIGGNVVKKFGKILHINSPSKDTMAVGASIVEGLTLGMSSNASEAYLAATAMSNGVIGAFNTTLQTASPSKVMMQIGQYVGQGFAQGIRGSQDQVRSAFTELNNKLTEAMADARTAIDTEEKKLAELRKAKKPDADAIAAAQKALGEAQTLLANATAGHNALIGTLKGEKAELIGLIGQYDSVTERLKAARELLKQRVDDFNQFRQSLQSQYSASPALDTTDPAALAKARADVEAEQAKLNAVLGDGTSTPEAIASAQASLKSAQDALGALEAGKILLASGNAVDQLATYEQAIKDQTTAVAQYSKTLEQLRKLGLDDTTYNKLLTEGTADQSFANQLLAGGRTAVQSLNTLDKQLMKVSGTLATQAAKNLKQAGIDAAEGLIKGLGSRQTQLRKQIDDICDEILRELYKKLKIKSPSRVFAEVGKLSMEGLAMGFSKSTKLVRAAVSSATRDALKAMRGSMGNVLDQIIGGIDTNPVIRPILDLTQVKEQAKDLAGLTNVVPIKAAHSIRQATAIGASAPTGNADYTNATPTHGNSVKFEQNIYSPEALTDIEIYRHTRNQLSQLKRVLAVT